MSFPREESPIINSDIENDVTCDHRNLIETGPGKNLTIEIVREKVKSKYYYFVEIFCSTIFCVDCESV